MRTIAFFLTSFLLATAATAQVQTTQLSGPPAFGTQQQIDLITADINRRIAGISAYALQQEGAAAQKDAQIKQKDDEIKDLHEQVTKLQLKVVDQARAQTLGHGPGKPPSSAPAK